MADRHRRLELRRHHAVDSGHPPDHDGLRIAPSLPADWEGFTATRAFRGVRYHVTVAKQRGSCGRVRSLVVDGRVVQGNVVPLPASAGGSIEVEAVIESA